MPIPGIVASSVVTAVCTNVLQEPFNNFTDAPWNPTVGPATISASGRTGTACQCTGTIARAEYNLNNSGSANATVTVGFAWRTNTTSTTARRVCELWSDSNSIENIRLVYNGTTARSFSVVRAPSTTLGTTATGLVPVNTWAYIELQVYLHDTAGTVILKVDGTERLNLTGQDTRTSTVGTVVDSLRLTTAVSGHTNLWDDLYLSAGSGCTFQGDHTIT